MGKKIKSTSITSKVDRSLISKFPNDLLYKPPKYMVSSIELISPQIITIENFFNDDFLKTLINSFSKLNLETTPLIKSKDYALRYNDRISLNDSKSSSNLWNYLYPLLINSDIEFIIKEFENSKGLNPNLRVYRYEKGHHFNKHYDESVTVSTSNLKGITKWTLLIYLTGDEQLVGGDTVFYESKNNVINIHPKSGMALLHKHGDDCLLHEAELVQRGIKWVLRSDVVF
ncbi:hypothetical protein WICMUC_001343 [Wickerhamomyces mucosus]|uniref:Prolyl 4-hydroxylase alpha subunit domain-containing protein n=1 Tax=Wickerhamomyces mucosus TaxID=1378264 RepID=A0A9P8PWR5_9ASCO|nr:hypothetical protein WICMUC_001343 [Wickerhamomyces mucosus]